MWSPTPNIPTIPHCLFGLFWDFATCLYNCPNKTITRGGNLVYTAHIKMFEVLVSNDGPAVAEYSYITDA